MPVRNEEKYLEGTIQSVLKNYDAIEQLIISDNASTDNTGEIAKQYASRYDKIKYIHHEKQITVTKNVYSYCLNLVQSKYVMVMGGHDFIGDGYGVEMVRLLENHPEAIVASGLVKFFDTDLSDAWVFLNPKKDRRVESDDIMERVQSFFVNQPQYTQLFCTQVFRTDSCKLLVSDIQFNWWEVDNILAFHMILLGKCVSSEKVAYYMRYRKPEDWANRRKRYEDFYMTNIPADNHLRYFINEYISLAEKYIPDFKGNQYMHQKIVFGCRKFFDAYSEDKLWLMSHDKIPYQFDDNKIREKLTNTSKKYVIFGAGKAGTSFYLQAKDIVEFAGFIDNTKSTQGTFFESLKVYSPLEFLKNHKAVVVILGSIASFSYEMFEQMTDMGFEYGENLFGLDEFFEI
jgi:glycosyltransferase involved in cell wall biosynthesis